ncbi:AMP-binding protein [Streptomyces anulatus]
MADVLAEVLGVDRVGLDDSFCDFGGTSLQAISVCVRLEKIIGRTVEPADILEHDVLADVVALLPCGPGAAVAERPLDAALVHEVVARHTRAAPESIALVHQDASFDYATLHAAAGGYAARLAEHGVVPGGIVPLLLPRSPELVAVQLAVLRLGASYTSLDPRWPVARLSEVLGVPGDPPVVGNATRRKTGRITAKLVDRARRLSETVSDDVCCPSASPFWRGGSPATGTAATPAARRGTDGNEGVGEGAHGRGGVAAGSRRDRRVVGVGEQIDVFDVPPQPARTSRPSRTVARRHAAARTRPCNSPGTAAGP